MDRITAGILGIGLPAMFFVVVFGASSSLYDVSATPPPPPEEPVQEEAAEAAPTEDDAATAGDDMAEAPADDAAAKEQMAEAETDAQEAPAAEDEGAETPAAEETAETSETAAAETDEAETTEMAVAAPEETAGEDATEEAAAAPAEVDLAALVEAGDVRAGSRLWRQCSACHVADQTQNRVGPHLVDVLGRERASIEDFRYSDALAGLDGVWTAEEMSAWLENPRDYAPGTSMSFRGLDDAEDRANIIAYLADLQLNGG